MAEALETKKRRLYKLLDNLSSSDLPSTTKSPSTSTTSSTAKRTLTATERFEEARERASKRLRHSTSTGSLSSLPTKLTPAKSASSSVAKKDAAGAGARNGDVSGPPPNFSPWSHEMFLQRLETFKSVTRWYPKPAAIGEVEWAKRGWRCVDVNTVGCKGGCERRLVVSLEAPAKRRTSGDNDEEEEIDEDEDEAQEAFEQALVERYKDVISEGHAPHCMWRSSGCRDDIYRIQVIRPSVWQPELRRRCKSLLDISPAVANVPLKALPTDGLKTQSADRLIKDLPPDLTCTCTSSSPSSTNTAQATVALTIALHGWRGAHESGSELLHCDACFQRIGLWMYQPDYRPSHKSEAGEEQHDDPPILDLTELHREHCPWRNADAQMASGNLKGLNAGQILQRVVSTFARDSRRRSGEQDGAEGGGEHDGEGEEGEMQPATPKASREEVSKADKEREGRLRRLKSLFSVRRKKSAVK